jgi:steroid delta-isomerase-like uncharacterized protein
MTAAGDLIEHVTEAFNARRLDRLGDLLTADAELVSPRGTMQGADATRAYLEAGWEAFEDLTVTLIDAVQDGAAAAAELRYTATHTGRLATQEGTVEPTGNRLAACELVIIDARQGQVTAWRSYYDQVPLLVAAGIVPAPSGGTVDHTAHRGRPGWLDPGVDAAALGRRFLALIDSGDYGAFDQVLTSDCVFVHPAAPLTGPDQIAAFMQPFRDAFPDAGHTVASMLVGGATVVVEGTWAGTHTGTLATPQGDLPATGHHVQLPFATIAQVHGGRLGSVHLYVDQVAFMRQLGLLAERGKAASPAP